MDQNEPKYLLGRKTVKTVLAEGDAHNVGDGGYTVGTLGSDEEIHLVVWDDQQDIIVACHMDRVKVVDGVKKIERTPTLNHCLDTYEYLKKSGADVTIYDL